MIDGIESFFILFLNQAHNTTGYAKIIQGGIAGTVVDPMIIARFAADNLARAAIIAHNHPSGHTRPSDADINLTEKIKNVLSFLDCKLIDHIILTEDPSVYYSFADEGRL